MIEATIAMVVLAIAAAGILLPFANAAAVQAEASRQVIAASLASELMEIIETNIRKGELGTDGYSKQEAGEMVDWLGQIHSDEIYNGFSRVAEWQLDNRVEAVDMVIATVTVYCDGQEVTKITTLIGDHE